MCISWIIKCLIIIDARCKHEDSFVTSVCLYVNSAPTGRLFIKLYVRVFFGNLSRKFDFRQNLTRLTDTLHEDLRTAISCRILLRTRNILDKNRRENQNAILCSITPPPRKSSGYEIMWGKNGRATTGLGRQYGVRASHAE